MKKNEKRRIVTMKIHGDKIVAHKVETHTWENANKCWMHTKIKYFLSRQTAKNGKEEQHQEVISFAIFILILISLCVCVCASIFAIHIFARHFAIQSYNSNSMYEYDKIYPIFVTVHIIKLLLLWYERYNVFVIIA